MYPLFFLLLIFSTKGNAFDITALLNQFPEFSSFNNYLTQTQVASMINLRSGITVLAVDNDNVSPLSGKPGDVRKVMSLHVVIGYFEVQKLQNIQRTTILTTLYQESGQATRKQGLLNVTVFNPGSVVIRSAAASSTHEANLVKSIFGEPDTVSILQINTMIVPVGIDAAPSPGSATSPAPLLEPGTPPLAAKSPSDPPTADLRGTPPGSAPSDAPSEADTQPGSPEQTPAGSPGSPHQPGEAATNKSSDGTPGAGTIIQFSFIFSVLVVTLTAVQSLVVV